MGLPVVEAPCRQHRPDPTRLLEIVFIVSDLAFQNQAADIHRLDGDLHFAILDLSVATQQ